MLTTDEFAQLRRKCKAVAEAHALASSFGCVTARASTADAPNVATASGQLGSGGAGSSRKMRAASVSARQASASSADLAAAFSALDSFGRPPIFDG